MKKIKSLISLLLTFVMLLSSFPVTVFAATDLIDNKTHDYDEITSLPYDYSYGTLVWSDESEVVYINTHSKYTKRNNNRSYVFGAENGGSFSFKITKCAVDKSGNLCDVIITVSNVKAFSNFTPANNQLGATFGESLNATNICKVTVSVTRNSADYGDLINFGFNTAGASAKFEMTYFLAGTNTEADIDYNSSTFTDIDISTKTYDPASIDNEYLKGNEGIAMPDSSIYYDKSSNWIVDGTILPSYCDVGISAPSRKDAGFDTTNARKETSCTALQKLNNSNFVLFYSGRQAGIGWVFISPYDYESPAPTISVNKDRVYEKENFNYTITQYMPNNYYADVLDYINGVGGKCKAFMIVDILDDNLVVNGDITVSNELGEDVTSYFDTNIVNHSLAVTAKQSVLTQRDFYAHFYNVNVPCYIQEGTGGTTGVIDNLANSLISNSLGTQNKSTLSVEVALKYDVDINSQIDNGVTYFENGVKGTTASSSNTINHGSSSSDTVYFEVTDGYEISQVFVDDEEISVDKLDESNGVYSYSIDDSNVVSTIQHNIVVYTVPKDTSVIVNYIDEEGEELAPSETITGKVFDDYSTEANEFYGYELTEMPSNATGTMTEEQIVVNYVYKLKDAQVIVQWVDDEGKELASSETITGKVFDSYSSDAKDFYGYRLTAMPSNASGTMTEEDITVTYVYTKKSSSVTANYLNEDNEVIASSETITGNVGDNYTTESKDIYGYELISTPSNANGNFVENNITVNYIYRLKDTSVVVNYITDTGDKLADSITINGKVFDSYSTDNKQFEGYELISLPSNSSGEMTEEQIVVNYVYRLKDTSVLVNYIDEEGNQITDSITISGKVFDEYTTESKEFYGYELVEVPDNATGEMTVEQIVVNYVYRLKDTSVIVNYIDENYVKIADSETINGKVFDSYTTSAKDIYGYELTTIPDNASGEMTEDVIEINYIYRLKDAVVTVKYVDENDNPLSDDEIINGKVFDKYESESKDIYGYELVEVPDNATGEMTEEPITVIYKYKAKDLIVIVNYVDESGNPVADSDTFIGKVYEEYSTSPKDIYGYDLIRTPDNASGKFTEEPIIVTYVYRLKDTSVLVNYFDENGNSISDSITLTGKVNDDYSTSAKNIYGYELTSTPENSSGKMTEEQIIVNYIYKLKDAQVIVQWVDDEGNELAPSETITGKVFDKYTSSAKDIYGYRLTATPVNATGEMTEDEITVTYVYTKKPSSAIANYIDKDNNIIAPSDTFTGNVGDEYASEPKEIEGYELIEVPDNASGVMTEEPTIINYIYQLKDTSVLVKYTDEDGKELVSSETITGKVFDKYNTESKVIKGYELVEVPDNASGTMTEEQIVVNYIYRLKETKVIITFVDKNGNKITEDEIITGKVFDEYTSEPKEIEGYKLVAVPENASGEMAEDTITVTYIYQKINTPVELPDTGDSNHIIFTVFASTFVALIIVLGAYIILRFKNRKYKEK